MRADGPALVIPITRAGQGRDGFETGESHRRPLGWERGVDEQG